MRQEREHYEYVINEGKIICKQSGEPLDTCQGTKGTKWFFCYEHSKITELDTTDHYHDGISINNGDRIINMASKLELETDIITALERQSLQQI